MINSHNVWSGKGRPPGHDDLRGGLRFTAELITMTATPWALWPHSVPLAIAAVLLLVGLPALLSTPGGRPGGGLVTVPGSVTILIVLLHLAAASIAAWTIWPGWLAAAVTALCLVVIRTEYLRWKALLLRRRHPRASTTPSACPRT